MQWEISIHIKMTMSLDKPYYFSILINSEFKTWVARSPLRYKWPANVVKAVLWNLYFPFSFKQPPPVSSRNGVLRGYFVLYREDNKYYRDKNLTVRGGESRNYLITNLKPYKIYLIEIQAFTRAGVSPRGKERKKVQTHEDGERSDWLYD